MDYDLSEEQKLIKDTAHKFLAKTCPSEYVREMAEDKKGFTQEIWDEMADMGWMSLLIPEDYGGYGGKFLDLAVLLSEMGYYRLPGPFFSTAVLGGLTLMEAANDAQKAEFLPDLASGKRIFTLAWTETDGLYTPEGLKIPARQRGDEYVLSGTKLFVPDAHVADLIICVARTEETGNPSEGLSLFLVDATAAGLSVNELDTMAGDKQHELIFNQVVVPGYRLMGRQGNAWQVMKKILLMAAVAKAAEMLGGGERVMELVLPWIKERVQFGRPVGSFQAVHHHCANMLTYLDTFKYLTYQTAWRISEGLAFEKDAAMCKAWASDSYRKLVALGHQAMGGIGFMEEHDLQLYFKHAKTSEIMFGDADFHRELVACEMGL